MCTFVYIKGVTFQALFNMSTRNQKNLNFRVSEKIYEAVMSKRRTGESVHQTAQRILAESLTGHPDPCSSVNGLRKRGRPPRQGVQLNQSDMKALTEKIITEAVTGISDPDIQSYAANINNVRKLNTVINYTDEELDVLATRVVNLLKSKNIDII